ncbi:hypothetical protein AcW1_002527 [Taiwanofungus camphoratus]|nr:hypothetical protein AcW1_002527 [Antrodia cinnamomea]
MEILRHQRVASAHCLLRLCHAARFHFISADLNDKPLERLALALNAALNEIVKSTRRVYGRRLPSFSAPLSLAVKACLQSTSASRQASPIFYKQAETLAWRLNRSARGGPSSLDHPQAGHIKCT